MRRKQQDKVFEADEIIDIKLGVKRIYLYGTIRYQSVYGIWHHTNFCYSVAGESIGDWISNDTNAGALSVDWDYADTYNDIS